MIIKRTRLRRPPHINSLKTNLKEIDRILEIHGEIAGEGPGYKHNVQVLNKSAIVLLLACWEAYIEDLAENSFKMMLSKSNNPHVFPDHVLAIVAKEVKKNGNDIWQIANSGWKNVMKSHKEATLSKYIERNAFNTPSPRNIDTLFSNLVGMTSLSRKWYWSGMSIEKAKYKLNKLIELRGNIAHRLQSSKKVTKTNVKESKEFILRLAVISNNRTFSYLKDKTGIKPWLPITYKKTS